MSHVEPAAQDEDVQTSTMSAFNMQNTSSYNPQVETEGGYVNSSGGMIRKYANKLLQRSSFGDTRTTSSMNQSVYMDSGSNDANVINVNRLNSSSNDSF